MGAVGCTGQACTQTGANIICHAISLAAKVVTDCVKAWQCIGCGMIEAPQTCIGVCEYRKTKLVYAFEHEQALAEAAAASHRAEVLESLSGSSRTPLRAKANGNDPTEPCRSKRNVRCAISSAIRLLRWGTMSNRGYELRS